MSETVHVVRQRRQVGLLVGLRDRETGGALVESNVSSRSVSTASKPLAAHWSRRMLSTIVTAEGALMLMKYSG
jgi:hypothetical protein